MATFDKSSMQFRMVLPRMNAIVYDQSAFNPWPDNFGFDYGGPIKDDWVAKMNIEYAVLQPTVEAHEQGIMSWANRVGETAPQETLTALSSGKTEHEEASVEDKLLQDTAGDECSNHWASDRTEPLQMRDSPPRISFAEAFKNRVRRPEFVEAERHGATGPRNDNLHAQTTGPLSDMDHNSRRLPPRTGEVPKLIDLEDDAPSEEPKYHREARLGRGRKPKQKKA